MKLLVCISKAPDTTSKIAFTDGDTKFDENGVQYIVNPYDEWYALVRALELTEANGGTVTTITVGTAADDPTIRKALAIGATDAVRVDAEAKDPYFVLPLIMGASMFFQQKLNPAPPDPMQAKVMQMLPIIFTAFFAFFPSGLVLYWVVNNLLSIAQQWKITKSITSK